MRKICLDTDFLVELLRGVPEAVRKAEELDSIEAEISIASMNACQLPLPKARAGDGFKSKIGIKDGLSVPSSQSLSFMENV